MHKHFPVVVECTTFAGCRSYGANLDEALRNLREAIEVCLPELSDEQTNTVFLGIRDIEVTV